MISPSKSERFATVADAAALADVCEVVAAESLTAPVMTTEPSAGYATLPREPEPWVTEAGVITEPPGSTTRRASANAEPVCAASCPRFSGLCCCWLGRGRAARRRRPTCSGQQRKTEPR